MTDTWYTEVEASEKLTQGNIIEKCPLIAWKAEPVQLEGSTEAEILRGMVNAVQQDVIVMTQACDLEQEKVSNVVLCPAYSLSVFRQDWEDDYKRPGKNPRPSEFIGYCKRIANGFIWNLAILNEGADTSLTTEHRIIDFHEVFTVPRAFLESLLVRRQRPRLRLLSPYREHLSQAFARYFMRVGLPTGINTIQ